MLGVFTEYKVLNFMIHLTKILLDNCHNSGPFFVWEFISDHMRGYPLLMQIRTELPRNQNGFHLLLMLIRTELPRNQNGFLKKSESCECTVKISNYITKSLSSSKRKKNLF